jgi:tripartite-type tricarboxylate transporter receptor subunit TctC
MIKRGVSIIALAGAMATLLFSTPDGWAADDFYKGKTFRLIVGFSPGGGYDTYTRLIARYFSKYIPGNPTMLVQNMTGAGSLIAANYIAKRAKPDGLAGAVFNNSLIVQKSLGDKKIKIPFEKLEWVGAPSRGEIVCMMMAFTGKTTLEDVLNSKEPLKMGATRTGSTGHDIPAIMNKTMGTNFEIITGYRGTATVRLALESHEIDGFCSQWESMRVTARGILDSKGGQKLVPYIIDSHSYQDPETKSLPLFKDVIKSKENLEIYESWASQMAFQRPLALPPGTPKDRLQILRRAYAKTLKDPALLAEAKKAKLVITYVSGPEVAQLVAKIINMPQKVKESLSFLVRK